MTTGRPPRDVRAPSLHDVGRLAGVSHQTVSRVLNGHPHVSPATRAEVERAIATLGYRPNDAARALKTSRSRIVGIVAADTTLFGPASILVAVERAARARGHVVNVASLPDLTTESVREAFRYLLALRPAGIIVIAPQRTAADAVLEVPSVVPVVAIDGGLEADLPVVGVDQAEGARLVTEHLLSLGHRTVHHVAGPADWLEATERVAGWRGTLRAHRAEVPRALRGDWTAGRGYDLGRRLAEDPAVTAVFVANDQMALGVLRALQEAGRDVPGDVSVAGFDDVPESRFFGPSLTTVRQNFAELGTRSVDTLLELLAGATPPPGRVPERTVSPELVARASTGPPRR